MPEGPSIVILKELIVPFVGKVVEKAKGTAKDVKFDLLDNQKITDVKSFGKNLLICFPTFTLRIHLMLFGTYRINDRRDKLAKISLQFDDGEINFYACIVELLEEPLDEIYDWQADIMNPKWNSAKAIKKMNAEPAMLVCDALMDQDIFAGVGNIIKNEVLFNSYIHPASKVGQIPTPQKDELINEVIRYSRDFLKWKKDHTLSKHWQVYSQKTCPRDHVALHKKELGKSHRTTYYCDLCQKLYA